MLTHVMCIYSRMMWVCRCHVQREALQPQQLHLPWEPFFQRTGLSLSFILSWLASQWSTLAMEQCRPVAWITPSSVPFPTIWISRYYQPNSSLLSGKVPIMNSQEPESLPTGWLGANVEGVTPEAHVKPLIGIPKISSGKWTGFLLPPPKPF